MKASNFAIKSVPCSIIHISIKSNDTGVIHSITGNSKIGGSTSIAVNSLVPPNFNTQKHLAVFICGFFDKYFFKFEKSKPKLAKQISNYELDLPSQRA